MSQMLWLCTTRCPFLRTLSMTLDCDCSCTMPALVYASSASGTHDALDALLRLKCAEHEAGPRTSFFAWLRSSMLRWVSVRPQPHSPRLDVLPMGLKCKGGSKLCRLACKTSSSRGGQNSRPCPSSNGEMRSRHRQKMDPIATI